MEVVIKETYEEMCRAAAEAVASVLNAKPNAVLGLAVGNTHIGLYRELVRMFKEGLLDFSQVTTFNLDEYVGLGKDHPQSQYYFMHENFFKYVNLSPQNIYMPSGTAKNYRAFCAWYEQRIKECGGIDLQILGIGTDGHIAFNEPGSSLGSRTRIKTLSERRLAEIKDLFDEGEELPIYAITMGVGTILEARRIILLAHGAAKADAVAAAIEGPVTSMVTASALQLHRDTIAFLDREAASKLKLFDYYLWVQKKRPGAPGY
ncbi:glucosamine-6-phosphate deaminase [Thermogutta sp.]|jgi:glucosamine-6-phosphate deaminase|uniref:glucosamine-6-phosphate deaminase n=1 Tax=Thermogutta sp. TaxID=1962930 RepID=UPI00321F8A19